MGFRMITPGRIKKAKSQGAQEALDRLQSFLDGNIEKPIRILCGFWKDQQDAISYQELRQAVITGVLDKETIHLWQQDYSVLVKKQLGDMWKEAMKAGAAGQPILNARNFEFDTQKPGILNWISRHGAEFVTNSTQEQKDAIAALLVKKMRDGHTVDELAKMIRPCIGLTEQQAKANARYYDSIVANLKKEHPRMKAESIHKKAQAAALKYAERQHRQRAMTIAQTECAYAYNRGADEAVRQAQAQNLIGTVKKHWSTSGGEGVCSTCEALEGTEIDMDKGFQFKGKPLFAGQDSLPPAHPRCACAIEYIEVSPPDFSGSNDKTGDIYNEESIGMQKLGEIDMEKAEEALEYYGNLFRNDTVENVLIIDKSGNVYHTRGDTAGVDVIGVELEGAFITHNHPAANGITSFGENDFLFMKENPDIAKLQAVNNQYTYTAIPLAKIREISYNEIYREALMHAFEIEEEDLQHLAMQTLAEKGGILYVRDAVK